MPEYGELKRDIMEEDIHLLMLCIQVVPRLQDFERTLLVEWDE